ncbi:MAG: hypothetical protein JO138_16125 [Acidobacteriaceae bacterium]|nr:hypothetical protein [Acidobacteriaceae bacterium]
MITGKHKIKPIRVCVAMIALSKPAGSLTNSWERLSAQEQKTSGTRYDARRMADGKYWMTHNVNVNVLSSYRYEGKELNCSQYGRLYTWESARRVCQSLDMNGNYRQTTNSGKWRNTTVECVTIRMTAVKQRTTRSWSEAARDSMPCSVGRSEDGQYARLKAH